MCRMLSLSQLHVVRRAKFRQPGRSVRDLRRQNYRGSVYNHARHSGVWDDGTDHVRTQQGSRRGVEDSAGGGPNRSDRLHVRKGLHPAECAGDNQV